MMKRLFYLLSGVALLYLVLGGMLLVASCSSNSGSGGDEPDQPEQPKNVTLELSRTDLVFEAAGGEKTFTVSSNGTWSIENESGWCKTDFNNGTGNLTVTVTADAYSGLEDRNTNLTVKAGDKTQVLGVTQKCKDAILLSKDKFDVLHARETISVEVQSNIAYEVTIPSVFQSWIASVGGTSSSSSAVTTKTYRFVVSELEGDEEREGYIVFSGNSLTDTVYIYQSGDFTETIKGVSFDMVYVEGGTFRMGATEEQESDYDSDERPVHSVTLSNYYIGKFEVTQGLWEKVIGTTIRRQQTESDYKYGLVGVGSDYPMYYVNWYEAQEFCRKLSQLTGKTYVLPTEAQWEYAARGGVKSKGYKYSGSNTIGDVAWYSGNSGNSGNSAHPVGTKQPNELGLYDMSGNMWEWCSDWYASNYYSNSPQTNPTGPSTGSRRVLRGGCWISFAGSCRVSIRSFSNPGSRYSGHSFRVVLLL